MSNVLEIFYNQSDIICFKVEKTNDASHPFCVGVAREDDNLEEMLLTTEEAKMILKFLKRQLEPQFENK